MAGGYIGIIHLDLHLRGVTSLKEKRHTLAHVRTALERRFGATIAEVDLHDLRQRAELTAALVGRGAGAVEDRLDAVERWLAQQAFDARVVHRHLVTPEDLA
jgi:uncharacterized protein YlxP (DUF503 family)